MAWAVVQKKQLNHAGVNTYVLSFNALPSIGNHLIVSTVGWDGTATSGFTCTDNQGHTYTQANAIQGDTFTRIAVFSTKVTASSGTFTITVDPTPNAASFGAIQIWEISGLDPTAPVLRSTNAATITSGSAISSGVAAALTGDLIFGVVTAASATSFDGTYTVGTGFTLEQELTDNTGSQEITAESRTCPSDGNYDATFTSTLTATSTSKFCCIVCVFKIAPPSVVLEQEGYRWRNDDGSETTATWKAAQDTTVTLPAGTVTRLRVIVNATGDPSSGQYKLEYRKVGDTAWRNMDVFQ